MSEKSVEAETFVQRITLRRWPYLNFRISDLLFFITAAFISASIVKERYEFDDAIGSLFTGVVNFGLWYCAKDLILEIPKVIYCRTPPIGFVLGARLAYLLAIGWRAAIGSSLALALPVYVLGSRELIPEINELGFLRSFYLAMFYSIVDLHLLSISIVVYLSYRVEAFSFGSGRTQTMLRMFIAACIGGVLILATFLNNRSYSTYLTLVACRQVYLSLPPDTSEALEGAAPFHFLEGGLKDVYETGGYMLISTLLGWILFGLTLRREISIRLRSFFFFLMLAALAATVYFSYRIRFQQLNPEAGFGYALLEMEFPKYVEWLVPPLFILAIAFAQNWSSGNVTETVELFPRRGRSWFIGRVCFGLFCIFSLHTFLHVPTAEYAYELLGIELPFFRGDGLFFEVPNLVLFFVYSIPFQLLGPIGFHDSIPLAYTLLIYLWIFRQFRNFRTVQPLDAGYVSIPGFLYSAFALTLLLFATAETLLWFWGYSFLIEIPI